MDVLILLLFVSLVLVLGALLLFAKAITSGDFEHGDRLALLPLEREGRDAFDRDAGRADNPTSRRTDHSDVVLRRADQAVEAGEEILPT